MMARYLVGFQCVNKINNISCDCTVDVPEDVKKNFYEKWGFNYDEFCYYDLVEAEDEFIALEEAYKQQGATEEEKARDIWPNVEIIGEICQV